MTRTVSLKHLCARWGDYGLNIPSDEYMQQGVRLLRTSDIRDDGSLLPESEGVFVPTSGAREHMLEDGDVLFSRSGTVGRSFIYREEMHGPCTFAGYLVRFTPKPNVDARFIYYFSKTHLFHDQVLLESVESTITNFNAQKFGSLRLPAAEPGQQRAIADFLDRETTRIDALVAKKHLLSESLEQRWGSELWIGTTRGPDPSVPMKPSGLDWVDEVPRHWSTPPVYARFEVQLGKMLNPERAAGDFPAPYLRNVNVQWDRFELDDLGKMSFTPADRIRYRLEPGDLLVCEGGEVGRAAVWNEELEECFYQKAIHRVRARGDDSTRFLMYALWAAASHNVFVIEGNRSTIVHLTAEQLREHRFPMPPADEQRRIVVQLDERRRTLGKLKAKLDEQIALLRERRQSLITTAVTGELPSEERESQETSLP